MKFVAYYRVSTEKRGRSGLGLEAQKEAITGYIDSTGDKFIASYILRLIDESGVEIHICDPPNADKLTIAILAAVAEREAENTSKRTKAALAVRKAQGVKLGNPMIKAAQKSGAKANVKAKEVRLANVHRSFGRSSPRDVWGR